MGYCPLIIRQARAARRWARRRVAGRAVRVLRRVEAGLGTGGRQVRGCRRTRGARQVRDKGAQHGRCARGHARPGRASGPEGCALDEDVEDVHGALVRHHRYLTSRQCLITRLLLRL